MLYLEWVAWSHRLLDNVFDLQVLTQYWLPLVLFSWALDLIRCILVLQVDHVQADRLLVFVLFVEAEPQFTSSIALASPRLDYEVDAEDGEEDKWDDASCDQGTHEPVWNDNILQASSSLYSLFSFLEVRRGLNYLFISIKIDELAPYLRHYC